VEERTCNSHIDEKLDERRIEKMEGKDYEMVF